VNTPGDYTCLFQYDAMGFERVVSDGTAAVRPIPVQFGGGLIELAVPFLILALVAALLGARGIAKWLVISFVVLAVVPVLL